MDIKKLTDPTCDEINRCAFHFLQRIILTLGIERNLINAIKLRYPRYDCIKVYDEDIKYYNFFDNRITWDATREGFRFWHQKQVLLSLMLFMVFPYSRVLKQYCDNLLHRINRPSFNKDLIARELNNINKSTL